MSRSKSSRSRAPAGDKGRPDALAAAAPALAEALYNAVAYTSYTPLGVEEVRARLRRVADDLVDALTSPAYTTGRARAAGATIVELELMQPEALGRLQTALINWVQQLLPSTRDAGLRERMAHIAGDVATGFAAASRDAILLHQEQARAALLLAERRMQVAEDARSRAEAAVRVRTEVLHAAAHDLRAPVTTILGQADLLGVRLGRDTLPAPDVLRAQVAAIRAGAQRINVMVDELLDIARLQAGQTLELQLEPVDVGALLREVASARASSAVGAAPIAVDAPDGLVIEGDRARLERVIDNVLGNAIKYSTSDAPVELSARALDGVTIVVRDQGVGIPADELPRLFTPFFRASTARGIAGIGIGLSGSKRIVEQHGGTIAVESAVDRGTTVTITLPVSHD